MLVLGNRLIGGEGGKIRGKERLGPRVFSCEAGEMSSSSKGLLRAYLTFHSTGVSPPLSRGWVRPGFGPPDSSLSFSARLVLTS
jgi:hypothetical protein